MNPNDNNDRQRLSPLVSETLANLMSNHHLDSLHPGMTPSSLYLTHRNGDDGRIEFSISLLDCALDTIMGLRKKPVFTPGYHRDPHVGLFTRPGVFDDDARVHPDFDATQFLELVQVAYEQHG